MTFCPFCEIIGNDRLAYSIYEDEHTLAFLDINPEVEGHTLVVPKKHVTKLNDLDKETLKLIMETTQKVVLHYESIGYCEGANIMASSGVAADQSVPHFHIHVLPRHLDDGFDSWPVNDNKNEAQFELERVLKKLKL